MSKLQGHLSPSMATVVMLLLTIATGDWAMAQTSRRSRTPRTRSARAVKQQPVSTQIETQDSAITAIEPRIDEDTVSEQGRGELRPRPIPAPIPSPTPTQQDHKSTFESVARELEQLEAYFSGGSGTAVLFNSDAAWRAGHSTESIKLAEQIAGFTNDLMLIALDVSGAKNPNNMSKSDDKAELLMQRATVALENYSDLSDFFSLASQRHAEDPTKRDGTLKSTNSVAAALFESPATVCGSFLTPRPSRSAPWVQFRSSNPWNTLTQWGYHPTPDYVVWNVSAGGGWTRAQTYRSDLCKRNSFRDHAIIDSSKTFREQKYAGWTPNGEPNPEVWNYTWPYPTWPAYVFWWHRTR